MSVMLRNAVYSGPHRNATTVAHVRDHEVEMELDAERSRRLTVNQWIIPRSSNDESLTDVGFVPSQSASRNHAVLDGVITLLCWLICECSNTVEQRMISGGSNSEKLTDVTKYLNHYLTSREALCVHSQVWYDSSWASNFKIHKPQLNNPFSLPV